LTDIIPQDMENVSYNPVKMQSFFFSLPLTIYTLSRD